LCAAPPHDKMRDTKEMRYSTVHRRTHEEDSDHQRVQSVLYVSCQPNDPHLSLHDALPISVTRRIRSIRSSISNSPLLDWLIITRSEEHTSELQSRENLVCRLLLEKKTAIRLVQTFMMMFCPAHRR